MTDFEFPIDNTKEAIYNMEIISKRLIQEINKTRENIDICLKITNNSSISFTIELLIKAINEIKRSRKIKSRCIINNTKENFDYFTRLISVVDEVRYSDIIESSFFINETTYASIEDVQRTKLPQQLLPHVIIHSVKSFVKQQKHFFDLLWNSSTTLENQIITVIGKEKSKNGKEISHSQLQRANH